MNLILMSVLAAGAFDQVFDQGVTAYEREQYSQAIVSFEQLIDQGVVDPVVFFNLGNAYYRNGELGAAIANYERALQLEPAQPLVRENLQRAISQTERALPRPSPPAWESSVFFWNGALTASETLAAAALLWMLAWVLLIVRTIKSWPYLRSTAAIVLLASVLLGASWLSKQRPAALAVAAESRVPVRYGNRPAETVRFELYEGDRVRVEHRQNGWARVRTADGERGWAEEAQLCLVGPPYLPYSADLVPSTQGALQSLGYSH